MSEENKKEKEEIPYSKSFEEFEKSRATDPLAKMLFGLLDGFEDGEFKQRHVDNTKKLMHAADLVEQGLQEILKTKEGQEEFVKELKKKLGEM